MTPAGLQSATAGAVGASLAVEDGGVGVLAQVSWPVLSRIPLWGDLALSPHGIAVGLGAAVGAGMFLRRVHARPMTVGGRLPPGHRVAVARTLVGWSLLGGIAGARVLFHVLFNLAAYDGDWWRVVAIWEGGASLLGGVAVAVGVGAWLARRGRMLAARLLDAVMPGLAVGVVIGRLGDLVIGDHLGAPTSSPLGWSCVGDLHPVAASGWGMVPPAPYPFEQVAAGLPAPTVGCFDTAVHATAMYDLLAAAVVVVLVVLLERRWRTGRVDGGVAAVGAVVYALGRLLGDGVRLDHRVVGLTGSQWAALAVVVAIVAWWVRRRTRSGGDRAAGRG